MEKLYLCAKQTKIHDKNDVKNKVGKRVFLV